MRAQPTTVTLLTIDQPNISSRRYSLNGQVKYEGVEGTGYLEMWNHFPGGGQYFSRTLADQGPMMKLSGTSGWRPFTLPFDATGAPSPQRLVVNLVLQGRGAVQLSSLQLVELDQAAGGLTGQTADRLGALGGVAGSLLGCVGAVIGVLTSTGRARRFVIGSTWTLFAVGVVAFVTASVALARSQGVAGGLYSLVVVGFLASVLPLVLLPRIRKRYEEIEFRTMRAHDMG